MEIADHPDPQRLRPKRRAPEDEHALHGIWREVATIIERGFRCEDHIGIWRQLRPGHTSRHVENVLATMRKYGLVYLRPDGWRLTRRGAVRLAMRDTDG